ncbi:MAG: GGDEF domain-containing protein [Lachnospiraceae bacterium]
MRMKNNNKNSTIVSAPTHKSEILNVAMEQTNIHVFLYDTLLKKIYFFQSSKQPFGILKKMEYSVQEIRASGIVDADNENDFKNMFDSLDRGEKNINLVVKTQSQSVPMWNHIIMTNYYDEAGNPIRAIGSIQDVSKRMETELRYSQEKKFRFAMLAEARRVYEINVTRDRFVRLESIQDTTDYGNWDLYTESMAQLCKTKVYREDWEDFLKIATRDHLLEGYKKGITEFYCEYRTVDCNGETAWASSATHLLQDPISNDIKGFIYVKDIDQQKKKEIELFEQAQRDPLTGVYNRRTAEQLIQQLLISSRAKQIHGFLIIDVDEFKCINDNFGHLQGDIFLQEMVKAIRGVLRTQDIFARMGGDEFAIFVHHIDGVDTIRNVARRISQSVQHLCVQPNGEYHTTVSIGISMYPRDGDTFEELYRNADISLYDAKSHGKNKVSIYGIDNHTSVHVKKIH